MVVFCPKCRKRYDDVYRWRYCPHDRFTMNTVVLGPEGVRGVAHTVPELRRMIDEGVDGGRRT